MSNIFDYYKKFQNLLIKPVDSSSLVLFRIFFGIILAYYAYNEASIAIIHSKYGQSNFLFSFSLLDYLHLKSLSSEQLLLITKLTGIFACLIAFGLFYRFSLLMFIGAFGYTFLLDKTYYNNHYYLILLFAFLLIFMGAHRSLSLDALRKPKGLPQKIPFWNIFLLRAQICIVYFFAVIPKMTPDYLVGRHMSIWLDTQDKLPFLTQIIPIDFAVKFLTYAGLFFDLSIGFLLCYKPTRLFAIIIAITFHFFNMYMFDIGIFPYLMIASLILFVEPDKPRIYWQKICSFFNREEHSTSLDENLTHKQQSPMKTKLTMCFLTLYLLVQILIPLRHFLIPGDVSWTREGKRFSWMLMANVLQGRMKVTATDPSNNKNIPVNLREEIIKDQYVIMTYTPDMIHQFVQFLKSKIEKQGIKNPIINVQGELSFNGRYFVPYIDPSVNLADKEYGFMRAADWILPPNY